MWQTTHSALPCFGAEARVNDNLLSDGGSLLHHLEHDVKEDEEANSGGNEEMGGEHCRVGKGGR